MRGSEGGVRKGGVAMQKHIFPLPVCPDLIYATKPEFKMLDFYVRVYYHYSGGCPLSYNYRFRHSGFIDTLHSSFKLQL